MFFLRSLQQVMMLSTLFFSFVTYPVQGQTAIESLCIAEQLTAQATIADHINVTGGEWLMKWESGQVSVVPGTTIEFTFGNETVIPDLGTDYQKADHVISANNWLATGTAFGVRRADGALWLIAATEVGCQTYVVAH